MQINNLGGVRMPTATPGATQTARTSFSTLVQGGAAASTTGRAGLPGSSVIASAIAEHSSGSPGFGGPYLQAAADTASPPSSKPGGTTGSPGSEFNGELAAMFQEQKAALKHQKELKELIKRSLISFVNSTFSMGQNRPKAEEW